MKAVIWTDVFQSLVILAGLTAVLTKVSQLAFTTLISLNRLDRFRF